jgi:hypothetical protein
MQRHQLVHEGGVVPISESYFLMYCDLVELNVLRLYFARCKELCIGPARLASTLFASQNAFRFAKYSPAAFLRPTVFINFALR